MKNKEDFITLTHRHSIYPQVRNLKDGRQKTLWVTKTNDGRQVTGATRERLLDKLYSYYTNPGTFSTSPHYKLRNLFPKFMDWKSEECVTGKTLKEYTRIWDKYYNGCPIADRNLTEISAGEWYEFFRQTVVKYKLTKKAFFQMRIVLSGILSYCIEKGLIEYSPIRDIDFNRLPYIKEAPYNTIKAVPFTPSQTKEIAEWCNQQIDAENPVSLYYLAISFNLRMGLRYAEMAGLRWRNVDFERKCVTVSGQSVVTYEKNKDGTYSNAGRKRVGHVKAYEAARTLPLSNEALNILQRIRQRKLSGTMVFPDGHFRYNTYREKIKDAAEALGLDRSMFRTHSLRATAATNIYIASLDLKQVQVLMGHTNLEMSSKYVKDMRGIDVLRTYMEKSEKNVSGAAEGNQQTDLS